jgi:hypothetical protein
MKIKRGINYALVLIGVFLLFAASRFEYPEIGMGFGFAFLMAGIYRVSLRTGQAGGPTHNDDSDVSD